VDRPADEAASALARAGPSCPGRRAGR
jgi:hypothetical protein